MSGQSPSPARLAQRDATSYNCPDVRSPKVYHVIVSPPYVAACNTVGVLLSEFTEQAIEAVPVGMRCRRAACRSRWESVS